MSQALKGRFVQFPEILIDGYPELTNDDRWVLIRLMKDHWGNDSFKSSYRQIAAMTKLSTSLLCSYISKKTGELHEGILDRIIRVTEGYISVVQDRQIDPRTGEPKGNASLIIAINYAKIWQDNIAYCEEKPVSNTNKISHGKPVSNTNGFDHPTAKPVLRANGPVSNANHLVSDTNEPVSNTNGLVLDANTFERKSDHNIVKTEKTIEDKEDVCTVLPTPLVTEHCFAIAQPAHTSISNDILSDSKPKEAKAAIVSSPSIAPKMETVASSPPPPKGEKPKGSEKPPASGKTGTKLNEDEQRIYDWWCDVVGCEVRITQTVQFRCSEIAPYVQDQDTFKREYAILKRQWRYPDSIKLGNLLDHLKGKQARDQTQHRTPESVQRAATHNKSQIERMKLMIEKRKNGEKDQCAAI